MTDVKELMAKVGKIRILTNKLIDDQLAGDYHSTFKGQGVEFDEVRPYQVGDDVRTIDWTFNSFPSQDFKSAFSDALLEYVQGTKDWDYVKKTVIDSWKSERA